MTADALALNCLCVCVVFGVAASGVIVRYLAPRLQS